MRSILCLLVLVLTLAGPAPAAAESQQWRSRDYDFSKVKTILVLDPVIHPAIAYPNAFARIGELLTGELNRREIKYLTIGEIEARIAADGGPALAALAGRDPTRYQAALAERLPNYVEAVLVFEVHILGWSDNPVKETVLPLTGPPAVYFDLLSRPAYSGTVTYPSNQYSYVFGGNTLFDNAAASARLYDAAGGRLVWGYADHRGRPVRPGANQAILPVDASGPPSMLGRIILAAVDLIPVPKKLPEKPASQPQEPKGGS